MDIHINVLATASQTLEMEHGKDKATLSMEEMIPKEYHEFLDLFDEKKAD